MIIIIRAFFQCYSIILFTFFGSAINVENDEEEGKKLVRSEQKIYVCMYRSSTEKTALA